MRCNGGNGGKQLFAELLLGEDPSHGLAARPRPNDHLSHHQKAREYAKAVERACHLRKAETAMVGMGMAALQRRP